MIDLDTKFVAVAIYTVPSDKLATLIGVLRAALERDIPTLSGFREGIVMTDEEQTQVLIVTQWDSKSAWARAEWEPKIGEAVAASAKDATTYTVRTFIPKTVVRPAP
jgi:heme-degrading monooxygenase HmoA